MNWTTIRTALVKAMTMNKMLLIAAMFAGMVLASAQYTLGTGGLGSLGGSSPNTQGINTSLCHVIQGVQQVVAVVSILLFVLGGLMYAIAHMMPAAGQLRGNLQGWSMGMIVGGIVGLILVLLAPGLVGFIVANGQQAGGAVTSATCSSFGINLGAL